MNERKLRCQTFKSNFAKSFFADKLGFLAVTKLFPTTEKPIVIEKFEAEIRPHRIAKPPCKCGTAICDTLHRILPIDGLLSGFLHASPESDGIPGTRIGYLPAIRHWRDHLFQALGAGPPINRPNGNEKPLFFSRSSDCSEF